MYLNKIKTLVTCKVYYEHLVLLTIKVHVERAIEHIKGFSHFAKYSSGDYVGFHQFSYLCTCAAS